MDDEFFVGMLFVVDVALLPVEDEEDDVDGPSLVNEFSVSKFYKKIHSN